MKSGNWGRGIFTFDTHFGVSEGIKNCSNLFDVIYEQALEDIPLEVTNTSLMDQF